MYVHIQLFPHLTDSPQWFHFQWPHLNNCKNKHLEIVSLLIIDDPVQSTEKAVSAHNRQIIWITLNLWSVMIDHDYLHEIILLTLNSSFLGDKRTWY